MKDWLRRIWVYWPSIVFVTLLNGGIVWYSVTAYDRQQIAAVELAKRQAQFAEKREKWRTEWVSVLKEKEIGQGEKIRLLQVPSPELDFLSSRCLLYSNAEYKIAEIACTDWGHHSISKPLFDSVE